MKRSFTKTEKEKLVKKIIKLRDKGLSNKQVAEKLGLKLGTVSSWYFLHEGYIKSVARR